MDKAIQKKINKCNRKRGSRFEKTVADYLHFEVVPYSGSNARFGYGDVRNDKWLVECKNITLDGDKITLKRIWFDKNEERANEYNKKSCIAWMPAGRADKFIVTSNIKWKHDKEYKIEQKIYNTKNLIIHMSDGYIKDVRNGYIVRLITGDDVYYMMSLEKFREML